MVTYRTFGTDGPDISEEGKKAKIHFKKTRGVLEEDAWSVSNLVRWLCNISCNNDNYPQL